ncbi:quaternary ammonium compound efflux SMR transporter SugE [Azospirillum sp. SYSU D00513]|uniref:quaternary ammonium compound efflux SMR transporter SugE n=1 Tax=Azospirillum sp. SYSU D00513 TaxID=2812561 RepID=UPI001A957E30|nr:quaternary ammonium compound efflux SMR transporter SugE [Azospirillum sp. SYSU D00513]
MAWVYLFIAGLLEIVWAIGLKHTDGFSKLAPTAVTVTAMLASVLLLGLSLKTLPIGTAYAVWSGIGIVGTALTGILLYGEAADALRIGCMAMIIAGIAGLKLLTH